MLKTSRFGDAKPIIPPRKYTALALWPREEVAFPKPNMMPHKEASRIPKHTVGSTLESLNHKHTLYLTPSWEAEKLYRIVQHVSRSLRPLSGEHRKLGEAIAARLSTSSV